MHADSSSGVIAHMAVETKKMGKDLVKHEQFLHTEFVMLKRELDYQKNLGSAMNKNAVESQIHRATASVEKYIDRIMQPYIDHDISHEDLTLVLRKISDEVADKRTRVPQVSREQLKKIITKQPVYDGSLVIRLAVPLVEYEEFHTVLTVPFPDKSSQSVLKAASREVTLDIKNLLYLESKPKLKVRINESLAIVEATILRKINVQAPCDVQMIAFSKQQCPVVPLGNRSEWVVTPLKNVVQFISSEAIALICPNKDDS